MKAVNIFLLCILGAALLSTVLCNSASGPDKCCFDFFRNKVDKNRIASYKWTDDRCPIRAVILKGKKGRDICVNPNEEWVDMIIKFLDKTSV